MKYTSCIGPLLSMFSLCLLSGACQKKSLLAGCCVNEALYATFGNAELYIPNIFTPNGDHVNDFLFVQGDSIHRIHSLEIRNSKVELVYLVEDVLFEEFQSPWDGKVDGILQKGLYSVYMRLEAEDGTIADFESDVCNYPCGLMEGEEMISIMGCHFASEYSSFYPHYPYDYPGCFK